jgi:undecaprenyl diphosphate synthase
MDKLHVAIIMDGNGRWATSQGKKRVEGHKIGSEVVRKITTFASKEATISELTLYAFSTENWKRPKFEVKFLMDLLSKYLENEIQTYIDNGVRFKAIGDINRFSTRLQKAIKNLEEKTQNLTNLTQNLALNYGGRDEVIRGIKKIDFQNINQSKITENLFNNFLDVTSSVDILIRTGGDHRISNFLLWQIAYAEIFFIDKLWPEFQSDDLKDILMKFQKIERRFGGVK